MSRRITRLALVVLAVLVATGPSALALADAPDSEATAAVGPLDEPGGANATDGGTDDESADENPTDSSGAETTNETVTTAADDATETVEIGDETAEIANETTDIANETAEIATQTTDAVNETAETAVNETDDATDRTNAPIETDDFDATTDLEGTVADPANAAENAAENATSVADEVGDADVGELVDDVTKVAAESVPFESAASPLPTEDAAIADPPGAGGDAAVERDDEASASGPRDDSDSTVERDDATESESETTTATGDGEAGTTAAGPSDAESAASAADSDESPDRDFPAVPPSGAEAVAGVGALTAAVLFPQLSDGLAAAANAGALSATPSTAAGSQSASLRAELDRVWRFATAFRYSRYDDSDPLDHEARARLHETVERSPGAYLSAVSERADVAVSTARHHLDVLEDEGLVTTAKVRGKRRYFPAHSDDVELAAALEDDASAAVLRALVRLGDSHGGRLADELDRDPSTVSHHLSRLEDAGLVEREREGRAIVNRLAPGVERALGGQEIDDEDDATGETPAIAD